MRHQCALYAKNSIKEKEHFKKVFCAKWEDMMKKKRSLFTTAAEKETFNKLFYHPGDLAYQILKIDALKLLETKPLNEMKKSVWKSMYGTKMPKHFGMSTLQNP
jgi:hypothetical protein